MTSRSTGSTVSVVARSPGLRSETISTVVTVPTFRRPEGVRLTLQSLCAQETTRPFAVIVMENEVEDRQGAAAAAPFFKTGGLHGLVIVAHQRGNCSAYNAGWLTAVEQFPLLQHLLVMDDDEQARPDWLERMCSLSEQLDADIVGGPQIPVFADRSQGRWALHPVFAPPYAGSGTVPSLYSSGNLLIGSKVLAHFGSPFLDLRFNFMGGGDSDFLRRAADAGFTLAWCAEAIVHETVPPRRLEADWIRSRSLRNGVISALVEKKARAGRPLGRLTVVAHSLALLAAAPLRAAARFARTGSVSIALYPLYVALGRVMAEFGYANEQYRQPERN